MENKKRNNTKKDNNKEETVPVINQEENETPVAEQEESANEPRETKGTLFNTINYQTINHLDQFIRELTIEQANYCVIQACSAAHQRGAFSLEESEVLSKSIRLITTRSSS